MGMDVHAVTQFDMFTDHTVGTNGHVLAQFAVGMDNSSRMNGHNWSYLSISMAETSASQTFFPSTFATQENFQTLPRL